MNPLEKFRRQYLPTPEEKMIDQLMQDIGSFEADTWVGSLIDFMALDPRRDEMLPPETLETWQTLSENQRLRAFLFLLGAVKALMNPPQGNGDYVNV